jgi:hypothetical protein
MLRSSCLIASSIALLASPGFAGVWGAHDQYLTRITAGVELDPVEFDTFGRSVATGDFNNDGFADAAVGVPRAVIGGDLDAGSVHVFYGSANGLRTDNDIVFDQDLPDIGGGAEPGDNFGLVLATGDFDNDGFDDLAIGAPFEDVGSVVDAGAFYVLYGSASGLTAAGSLDLNEDAAGVPGTAETEDLMGFALAAGDFDNDGFDDLAVSLPGESVDPCTIQARPNEGWIHVYQGSASGITTTGIQTFHTGQLSVETGLLCGIEIGEALAAGDFDNDGFDDLAVGAPLASDFAAGAGGVSEAGTVYVVAGSASGLDVADSEKWQQDTSGVPGGAEPLDHMGEALAAGDFNGDGRADLAIGLPFNGDGSGDVGDQGGVIVLMGSSSLLTTTGSLFIDQGSEGVPDTQETDDRFGNALATGDFDGDGRDDLAIGAADEDFAGDTNAGIVMIVPSSASGLVQSLTQVVSQDTPGVFEDTDAGDEFGFALAAGDVNGDGSADLVVGIPFQNIGLDADCGAIQLLRGALFAADFEDAAVLTEWTSHTP